MERPPDDSELVILNRDLEAFLVHSRHFDLQRVTIAVFNNAGDGAMNCSRCAPFVASIVSN